MKKYQFGEREFRFFYMIAWMGKYWIKNKTNPAILSKLNPDLPHGGGCTNPKHIVNSTILQNNPFAKRHFIKTVFLRHDLTWNQASKKLSNLKTKKLVFKPDIGSRSFGVRILTDEKKQKELLIRRQDIDYIIQEYIGWPHELGVFYYKYPNWKKGKILGIADRKFEHIVDPKNKEQYINRSDLITKKLTDTFDRIIGDKKIYFCRFDIKAKDLSSLKEGEGFLIMEANAGPDAVPLHALDYSYSARRQLSIYKNDLTHAFNISLMNNHGKKMNVGIFGLLKYISYMIENELPLQRLRWRIRKITSDK